LLTIGGRRRRTVEVPCISEVSMPGVNGHPNVA
jgi:hypothetical protein